VVRMAALDELRHPHGTCEIEWSDPPRIRTVPIATDAVSRALRPHGGAVSGLRAGLRSWTGSEPADWTDLGSGLVMAVGDVVARHADEAVLAVRCGPRNWIARPDPASVVPSRVCWAGPLVFGVPVGAAGPVFVVGGVEIRCCEHAVEVVAQLVAGEAVTVPARGTGCASGLLGALWGAGLAVGAVPGSDR
jgi:hypothetical protein